LKGVSSEFINKSSGFPVTPVTAHSGSRKPSESAGEHAGSGSVGQRRVSRVVAVSGVSGVFQKIAKDVTRHYGDNVGFKIEASGLVASLVEWALQHIAPQVVYFPPIEMSK
jgi:hypothetical protein